jgi:hypothetical protein
MIDLLITNASLSDGRTGMSIAMQYCEWAASKGLLAIRKHVDVCAERLLAVGALLD